MTSGAPEPTTTGYAPNESRRAAALPSRIEEPFARQYVASPLSSSAAAAVLSLTWDHRQRLQDRDPWAASRPAPALRYANTHPGAIPTTHTQNLKSFAPPPGLPSGNRSAPGYPPFASTQQAQRWAREEWSSRPTAQYQELPLLSGWATSPLGAQFQSSQTPMPPGSGGDRSPRSGYAAAYGNAWPGQAIRRSSSEEARNSPLVGALYAGDVMTHTLSLQSKNFPQRRPSNRDEFDGPSQLLEKPEDNGVEPKEEDLPQLPITLYAQEQDEILSKVNDRLSQCAFDFVAKY
jgi:hypothetical protein